MEARRRALIELNGAILLSSMTALFGKAVKLPVNQMIFGRALIGFAALFLFLYTTRGIVRLNSRRDYGFFLLSGVLLALHWVTYFYAIQISTVATALVAFYSYPVISIILEPLFDRKPYRAQDFMVGCVVFAGVCILSPELRWSNQVTQGVVWGVISAVIFSVRNIVSRRHVRQFPGATVLLYQLLGAVICLFPFLWFNLEKFDSTQIPALLLMGTVFTVVHHSIIAHCLKQLSVKTMSVIGTIHPVYGALLAWIFLSEIPEMRVVAGGALVLAAAAYEFRWGYREG